MSVTYKDIISNPDMMDEIKMQFDNAVDSEMVNGKKVKLDKNQVQEFLEALPESERHIFVIFAHNNPAFNKDFLFDNDSNMVYIPNGMYWHNGDYTKFEIPEKIQTVVFDANKGPFYDSTIEEIKLPHVYNGVLPLDMFAGANNLKVVYAESNDIKKITCSNPNIKYNIKISDKLFNEIMDDEDGNILDVPEIFDHLFSEHSKLIGTEEEEEE